MYIQIYVCMYAHTHTHTHSHTHIHKLLFINIYPYAYILIWERETWSSCEPLCAISTQSAHQGGTSHTNSSLHIRMPHRHTSSIAQYPHNLPHRASTRKLSHTAKATATHKYHRHAWKTHIVLFVLHSCLSVDFGCGVCVPCMAHKHTHSQQTFSTTP